ncbi:MAG: hypothetical protein JWQ23_1705, partial [Herminiimonas sp.]|nr:hypothetical protein [Herminiimonas sp.]
MIRTLFAATQRCRTRFLMRIVVFAIHMLGLNLLTMPAANAASAVPIAAVWKLVPFFHHGYDQSQTKEYPSRPVACQSLIIEFPSNVLDGCKSAIVPSTNSPVTCVCDYVGYSHPLGVSFAAEICPDGYVNTWDGKCLPRQDRNPAKSDVGRPAPGACVLNPIDASSGNKYQEEIDYAATGAAALVFVRHYNSSAVVKPGRLGAQWRSRFDRSIRITGNDTISTAHVMRPEGKIFYFTLINGAWTADSDMNDRLSPLNGGGWQYKVAADQSTEYYDAAGRLVRMTDHNGASHTLAYDAQDRMATVSDAFGHSLGFEYDPGNRIAMMRTPGGDTISYAYDGANNLASVTYADGAMRRYLYENTAFPHALTGIIDENGKRYASWSYDALGRAIGSEHAGGADKATVSYQQTQSTFTDALGSTRSIGFTTVLGMRKSTGQSQPAGSGCGPASAATTYDANGNVATRTDFN